MKEARAEPTPTSAPSPGQQSHLARAVPRVLRVSHIAEAAEQLLHQEQGNLLQDGLLQVGCRRRASKRWDTKALHARACLGHLCGLWSPAPEPCRSECTTRLSAPARPSYSARLTLKGAPVAA